ncbi:MAG: hypothetical protein JNJ49_07610 [Bdellovibrionaceae bacterium]|nr:hypothetical protein [Pseudobdellovibrionaceae bacterium]
MRIRTENGFTELEFGFLVISGFAVVGILVHFLFNQSIQVERLNALVARDAVRLTVESALLNPGSLIRSAQRQPKDNELIRACLLGESRCASDRRCCPSHSKAEFEIVEHSDDPTKILPISGTPAEPSCLDQNGNATQATSEAECFATSSNSVEFICESGATNCERASAVFINYRLQFHSPFLKDDPKLTLIERSLPVLLNKTDSN